MMKAKLFLSACILGTLAGIGCFIWQRQEASALREEMMRLQQANREQAHRQTVAEAALKERAAEAEPSSGAATPEQVQAELAKARREVAELEAAWSRATAPQPSRSVARHQHFGENRDPEKGPVLIQHFTNKGQATPSAAFQSIVWALEKQDYQALTPLLALSPNGRETLHAMVARMDAAGQARYASPEKIVGVLLARDLLDEEGYEIGPISEPNSEGQAALQVLRVRSGRESKLTKRFPLQRAPAGWQLPITDKMIEQIPSMLESASMYVPPKRDAQP